MKIVTVTGVGFALFCLAAAHAQTQMPMPSETGFGPPGSYRITCRDIHMEGSTLVATCRKADGRWVPTSLPAIRGCIGDIGNEDGRLACNNR